jgi:hypothetical protein
MVASALITVPAAILAGCSAKTSDAPSLKVGLGETVITPWENLQMYGFARSQKATGMHDDLHARSIAVEGSNGVSVVLMTVSIVGMNGEIGEYIRQGVSAKTGIPADNVVISCTQTHSGPTLGGGSENYLPYFERQCIASAVKAWESRAPGRIGIGSTRVMELGSRRLLYGGIHPDPEVGIIKIEDMNGTLRGVAFNYGCHPSALDWRNTLYSEDWPYYAISNVKKQVGDTVWTAFFAGPEGNINVGYQSELSAVGVDMPVRSHWYIEIKGKQMSDAVTAALPSIKTSASADVKAVREKCIYPTRESYPVTLEQARRDAEEAKTALAAAEKQPGLEGTRILDDLHVRVFSAGQRLSAAQRFYSGNFPPSVTLEHQAVRIGDAVFVTFAGELFAEIGLRIKEESPLEKTFVLGDAPGPEEYLPTAKEFIEGDYEVDGSIYSPRAEQVCVDACRGVINRVVK